MVVRIVRRLGATLDGKAHARNTEYAKCDRHPLRRRPRHFHRRTHRPATVSREHLSPIIKTPTELLSFRYPTACGLANPMNVTYSCPSCGRATREAVSAESRTLDCPHCHQQIAVPAGAINGQQIQR